MPHAQATPRPASCPKSACPSANAPAPLQTETPTPAPCESPASAGIVASGCDAPQSMNWEQRPSQSILAFQNRWRPLARCRLRMAAGGVRSVPRVVSQRTPRKRRRRRRPPCRRRMSPSQPPPPPSPFRRIHKRLRTPRHHSLPPSSHQPRVTLTPAPRKAQSIFNNPSSAVTTHFLHYASNCPPSESEIYKRIACAFAPSLSRSRWCR